jgi:hypothetical protein
METVTLPSRICMRWCSLTRGKFGPFASPKRLDLPALAPKNLRFYATPEHRKYRR